MSVPTIPGPKRRFSLTSLFRMSFDTLGFFESLAKKYGDVVHLRIGTKNIVMINDPCLVHDVLIKDYNDVAKGRVLEILKHLLAEGLLTSEGEFHRHQRRLIQPAFTYERIASYANIMTDYSIHAQESWSDNEVRDVAQEMAHLTLRIAGKALFDSDVAGEASEIRYSLYEAFGLLKWMMLPVAGELVKSFPLYKRRFQATRKRLDETIYRLIAEHRADLGARHDLLSMLLSAQDEDDRGMMTDQQVRDEAMTILLAGHETMANALTWTWYLLSQNPETEIKLHQELDLVLNGRAATAADVPNLRYTKWVFAESLRLCPPAWAIGRRALRDLKIGDYLIPAGTMIMLCQFLVHRDSRYFENPEQFEPERWSKASQESRPKFAYFPFGGGHRTCIGESFAWIEGTLILATLASRWRLRLVAHHRVKKEPHITLRPKYGIKMIFLRRPELRSTESVGCPTA